MKTRLSLFFVLLLLLAACAPTAPVAAPVATTESAAEAPAADADAVDLSNFPVTIENCDRTITFDAPPQRVVVNDVNIVELFLALDLQDRMVGYSSVRVDKDIAPEYQAKLEGIPALADRYPSLEVLAGANPDFYLAGWNYGLSESSGLTPDTLNPLGIETYAISESCIRIMPREQISLEDTFTDLTNLGQIFGVEARAEALVKQYRSDLAEIQATVGEVAEPLRVFVYDSGEDTPLTAAKFATPNAMIEAAGGTNIFNDVESSWTSINWEDVVDRNPEFIVIIDYGEPNAEGKIAFLKSQPELADVDAIKNDRFVAITYAEATPGPRNVASTRVLAEAFYPEKFAGADVAPAPADGTAAFPVTVNSCGVETTYEAPPTRAVTMNQAATEIMLALGLEDHMAGTAYLDDEAVLPEWQAAYESVPVIADEYPSQEVLFAAEPDFVFAAYRSAFGDEAAGSREQLAELGINSYLLVTSCEEASLRPEKVTFDILFGEILVIGQIFGVSERAEALVAEMQADLDNIRTVVGEENAASTIFWFDSGDDAPFAGACCGGPQMLIEAVGAENIFAEVSGSWADVTWEEVVARDPQVIVLADATWSTAQEKIDLLNNNPAYASITAVQEQRFISLPFGVTSYGVRNVEGALTLARGLYPDKFE